MLNTHIFEINENIGALNKCDTFPKEIEDIINNIEFIKLVDDCNKSIDKLCDYLRPNLKKIRRFIRSLKEKAAQSGQGYADFKIDGMPIFKPKKIPEPLDYREILSQNNISEIKRKKEFAYKGAVHIVVLQAHIFTIIPAKENTTCVKYVAIHSPIRGISLTYLFPFVLICSIIPYPE